MKKEIKFWTAVIIFFALFLPSKAFTQAPDTSTMQKLLQYIFHPVNKTLVPTGILEEYGCPILPMATFNGV